MEKPSLACPAAEAHQPIDDRPWLVVCRARDLSVARILRCDEHYVLCKFWKQDKRVKGSF